MRVRFQQKFSQSRLLFNGKQCQIIMNPSTTLHSKISAAYSRTARLCVCIFFIVQSRIIIAFWAHLHSQTFFFSFTISVYDLAHLLGAMNPLGSLSALGIMRYKKMVDRSNHKNINFQQPTTRLFFLDLLKIFYGMEDIRE